jgi:hypothetical protein
MTDGRLREIRRERMTEVGIRHRARLAGSAAATRAWPGGRLRVRLWTWLHSEALIRGMARGPGDVAFVEDDRRRLAAQRENEYLR